MSRTLIVTNDFPPRPGGIQAFVYALARRLGEVVVYAPAWRGAREFDRAQPFRVVRHPTSLVLPTPAVAHRLSAVIAHEGCDAVLFGAAAPLGLLTPRLRTAGIVRAVGLTHGHETGWAMLPGARRLLGRIGDQLDAITYLGEYTGRRLARALSPSAAARIVRLAPGVDDQVFSPDAGGERVRARLGLVDRPVVACVSRLVPRKGQDTLVRAWPLVTEQVPGAALLLVGGGPYRNRLRQLVDDLDVAGAVTLTGSVPWPDLPAYFAAADVFAMPCRTRLAGLDVEGLGIVYLEAASCGLPIVAGNSGGAPEAVLAGETGYLVDGRSVPAVAERIISLLRDPVRAKSMGCRGREWVTREWGWDAVVDRLRELLHR